MLSLIHKECGSTALEPNTSVGEVCALPVDQFPFACFTCLEEIVDESELRLSEELGI
jgi:glycosylphosphatidylinositol transamidase (GPIT) subunit GPI8